MKFYTVLLLYPDYLSDNFGHETFCEAVEAVSPGRAVEAVQALACEANDVSEPEPDDFFPLFVCEGAHPDLSMAAIQEIEAGILSEINTEARANVG